MLYGLGENDILMLAKDPQHFLVIGVFSLLAALLLGLTAGENPALNFLEGLLLGVSITTNLAYLITVRKSSDSA